MAGLLLGLGAQALGLGPIGGVLAGLAGGFIDKMLFGNKHMEGPKLDSLSVTSSTEGAAMPNSYGIWRVSPMMFWATNLVETTTEDSAGGKGGPKITNYHYFGNFALALCDCTEAGPIDGIGRVWSDGKLLDMGDSEAVGTWRLYTGTATQTPDPLMTEKETPPGNPDSKLNSVPAYRNTAYIVFELMPLEKFGNRIPNLAIEVIRRPVTAADPIKKITAIMIAGQFGKMATSSFVSLSTWSTLGGGGGGAFESGIAEYTPVDQLVPDNADDTKKPNFLSALDVAQAVCPALTKVALSTKWYLDDLRAGSCRIEPRVNTKASEPQDAQWATAGLQPAAVPTAADESVPSEPIIHATAQAKTFGATDTGNLASVASDSTDTAVPSGSATANDIGSEITVDGGATYDNVSQTRKITDVADTNITVAAPWSITMNNVPFTIGRGDGEASQADGAIVDAINELKSRNLGVIFTPLLGVDVKDDNGLPNPYSDNAATNGQPAYPRPGKITVSPAIGFAGTVDQTAAAATQLSAFFGHAAVASFGAYQSTFSLSNGIDVVSGTLLMGGDQGDWGYRRYILHQAKLCASAGFEAGDAFIIGSGLKGLSRIRDNTGAFPFVNAMIVLAADCRAILGADVKIGYAADWDEYHSYQPSAGNVLFPLDALWADANIDFVGINAFFPLSDWRPGTDHLDYEAGAVSIYNPSYLRGNIRGGEYFDWIYASDADRDNQVRTAITDPLEPGTRERFIFRLKDIRGWWKSVHHKRTGGVRGAASAWTAKAKPVWFTQVGCPAIDKGSNQPDTLYSPGSDDSSIPYYSTSDYDPAMQYAYLKAVQQFWADEANNPLMPDASGRRMVDLRIAYTLSCDVNKRIEPRSHVMNAEIVSIPLADLIRAICAEKVPLITNKVYDLVRGYNIDGIMSPRRMLEPLMQTFLFDGADRGRSIEFFQRRASAPTLSFTQDDLVDDSLDGDLYEITRAQETDLPRMVQLDTADPQNQMQPGNFLSQRMRDVTGSVRTLKMNPPIVMDRLEAKVRGDMIRDDMWTGRERLDRAVLPPSALHLGAADVITIDHNGRPFEWRLDSLGYQYTRPTKATRNRSTSYHFRRPAPRSDATHRGNRKSAAGKVSLVILDLPSMREDQTSAPWLASYANPWNQAAVYRSGTGSGFVLDQILTKAAIIGATRSVLKSGPVGRWDTVNTLRVKIPPSRSLESATRSEVLNGKNLCAVRTAPNQWELIQFVDAELTAPGIYTLSTLLRGVRTTDDFMVDSLKRGAAFVFIDDAVVQSTAHISMRGTTLNWLYGPANTLFSDATVYQTRSFTFNGVALRPPSPNHLKGKRQPNDDVVFTWHRRTRTPNPEFDSPDAHLGEDREIYRIDIYDADFVDVIYSEVVNDAATWTYLRELQRDHWGALPRTINISVAQKSLRWGWGAETRAALTVRRIGQSIQTETQLLFDVAAITPTTAERDVINTAILQLKNLGIWDKLTALFILAGVDDQLKPFNWRYPTDDGAWPTSFDAGGFPLTSIQAPRLTPGQTSDDQVSGPLFIPGALGSPKLGERGAFGGAPGNYFKTNFLPGWTGLDPDPAFTRNSHHFGISSMSPFQEDAPVFGNDSFSLNPRNMSNQIEVQDGAASDLISNQRNGRAHIIVSRLLATEFKVYSGGTLIATETRASVALPTFGQELYLLAKHRPDADLTEVPEVTSKRIIDAVHFGAGLTDTEVLQLSKIAHGLVTSS